jgi:hypothetical protein
VTRFHLTYSLTENDLERDRYLTQLILAYPKHAAARLLRVPRVEGNPNVDAVLARFQDATADPMGKAIALAVILDQAESGEIQFDVFARQKAAQLFEDTFKNLADA